nr:MAG TPA: hypothetical protein [Caudoviricetes sp.]
MSYHNNILRYVYCKEVFSTTECSAVYRCLRKCSKMWVEDVINVLHN